MSIDSHMMAMRMAMATATLKAPATQGDNMPSQYNTGNGLVPVEHDREGERAKRPTIEEAEAILTLVRGGWLKLELTVDGADR